MPKMIVNARQLRLNLAAKRGAPLSLRQVAEELGEKDHRRLMKLENNDFQDLPGDFIAKVADWYHQQGIDATHIVVFDPNGQQTPESVAA
jgi:hypothetical protein